MSINIVYLPYRRLHYSETFIKLLGQIKNKESIHITVCGSNQHRVECRKVADQANALGISAEPFHVMTGWTNYMDKLKGAINSDYEYSIKIDEDIFLNPQTWDFWLENLHMLNDRNVILAPILSNGIPTCDNFIYNHFDPESKQEIEKIFSRTRIPNLWGANYSHINKLLQERGYESDSYYEAVANTNHFYKGIHPIRISQDAQLYLNQWIMDNFDKFFEERIYTVEGSSRPYFCNSAFAIRTEEWHKVLFDDSLFRDCFDEVALNNYVQQNNKTKLFISNNFGLHTMYNTVWGEMPNDATLLQAKEEEFFQFIKKQVNERL